MRICYLFSGLAILVAWLYPQHYLPWTTFGNDFSAFLALILLWVGYIGLDKKFSIFSGVVLLLVVIAVAQGLSKVTYFSNDAWMAAFYLLGAFFAYQLALSVTHQDALARYFAVFLVCGGVINAFAGICQWLLIADSWVGPVTGDRSVGFLAQANNYATLLFWAFCAATYLYMTRYISSFLYSLLSVILVVGIVLSESRTSVLLFLFFGGWVLWAYKRGFWERRGALIFLPLAFFGFFYFSFPFIDSHINFTNETGDVRLIEGPYANRLAIWGSLINPLAASPLWGYGLGQVSVAQFSYLNSFAERVGFAEHSHNILLDMAIWFGPFIAGLTVCFLLWWIGRRFISVSCSRDWFLLSCVAALIIHALLEYPIEYAYFLLPASLALGLVDNGKVKNFQTFWRGKSYDYAVFIFAVIFMVWIWKEYRILEEDHRHMRAQNFGLAVDPNLRLSESVILIDSEREYIRFARTKARNGMSELELEWMRKVTYRYPFAVLVYRYSVALALNDRTEEAVEELGKVEYYYGDKQYEYYKHFFDRSIEEGREM